MDWAALGRDGAGLFRAPPELNFFCGAARETCQGAQKGGEKRRPTSRMMVWAKRNFEQREGGGGDGDEVCMLCLVINPPGKLPSDMLQTHNEGPDNSGIVEMGIRSSSTARVALKVTSPSQWEAPSHSDGPSTQRDEATNLRLQRLNDVMAAKMRSPNQSPSRPMRMLRPRVWI